MINISNTELTVLRDKGITFNKHGLINITQMWKATGRVYNKRPAHWLERNDITEFISAVAKRENARPADLLVKKPGRSGGSFAHWQIALTYAKYLDHDFHMSVNDVFIRYQIADPTLAVDMAERMPDEHRDWMMHRVAIIGPRKDLTSTLRRHGVTKQHQFINCTNSFYKPILGGTAVFVRKELSLPPRTNIRNHLPKENLISIGFAEMVAKKNIERENLRGYKACNQECENSAKEVMNLLK